MTVESLTIQLFLFNTKAYTISPQTVANLPQVGAKLPQAKTDLRDNRLASHFFH